MSTLGYLFVLVAALIIRGVSKGRTLTDLPGDLAAMFTALVTSDQKALSGVLGRTGDANTPTVAAVTGTAATTPSAAPVASGALLENARRLAAAANNKYVWGGTGPSGYDCSGLVWAAMGKPGLRFTTVTFPVAMGSKYAKVATPAVGDVVLWSTHMGIVDGAGTMFSALNSLYGIIHSPISWGGKSAPTYWRAK